MPSVSTIQSHPSALMGGDRSFLSRHEILVQTNEESKYIQGTWRDPYVIDLNNSTWTKMSLLTIIMNWKYFRVERRRLFP